MVMLVVISYNWYQIVLSVSNYDVWRTIEMVSHLKKMNLHRCASRVGSLENSLYSIFLSNTLAIHIFSRSTNCFVDYTIRASADFSHHLVFSIEFLKVWGPHYWLYRIWNWSCSDVPYFTDWVRFRRSWPLILEN